MRRKLMLLSVLLLALGLPWLSAQAQAGSVLAVTTQRLNLRAGPGVEWVIVETMDAGTALRIDGRGPYTNLWVRGMTDSGKLGWVLGEYVSASVDELQALPEIWVDTPTSLVPPSAPEPEAPAVEPTPVIEPSAQLAPGTNYTFISGITVNARAIFLRGQQMGNRANVFSKVGDSITANSFFLAPISWGAYNLRDYSYLQPTVDYFSAQGVRTANSFANASLAATSGWRSSTVLDPNSGAPEICHGGESPLMCEYRLSKPALAFIMLGTNDLPNTPPDIFRAHISTIVQTSIDMGVIPVLSTIPQRAGFEGTVPVFNQIIVETARYYDVPLWDYESALRGLENYGLWDGTHPSRPPGTHAEDYGAAVDLSAENLRYGYTVRNLTALQALDAVWRQAMY